MATTTKTGTVKKVVSGSEGTQATNKVSPTGINAPYAYLNYSKVNGGNTYSSSSGYNNDTWNGAIAQKIKSGKGTYYTAYDNNGQLHYATSLKGLANFVKNANSGGQYVLNGVEYVTTKDADGNTTTVQKGLNDINEQYGGLAQGIDDETALNKQQANAQYDSAAKQAYIQYMQNKKAMKDQLSRNGYTGGASESSYLRLLNNYGTNYANNESARNTALTNLDIANLQEKNSLNREKAQAVLAYNQELRGYEAQRQSEIRQNKYTKEAEDREAKRTRENMLLQDKITKGQAQYEQELSEKAEKRAKTEAKTTASKKNKTYKDNVAKWKKSGKVYYTWTTTDDYGNVIYHASTSKNKAYAASGGSAISSKTGEPLSEATDRKTTKLGYYYANKYKD